MWVPKLIQLKTIVDQRGALSVADRELPFSVSRVFFVHEMKGVRGGHGHKRNRVLLFASGGRVQVRVVSSKEVSEFVLDSPKVGLLLEPEDWHEFQALDATAALTVLCSHHYDPDDYVTEKPR